jgi:DNA-binding SARP family transcriptional activator/tetratricopeptide (TPR) repeat protein
VLRVRVLGDLAVEVDGEAATLPSSAKVRAVLAWLALHRGMQPRSAVAARLWPDVLDASARASLRSAIWALRRSLGDDDGRLLVATRDQVGLGGPGVDVWVDLLEFDRLVSDGHPEEALTLGSEAELLAGIDEEWVYAARDEHRQRLMVALAAAADAAEGRAEPATAIGFDRRRTQLDPLSEPAHRDLIRRLDAAGDRGAALTAYTRLRDRMRRELSLSPSPATRAAVDAIRAAAEPGEGDGTVGAGTPAEGLARPRPVSRRPAEAGAAADHTAGNGHGERRGGVGDRVRALPPLAGREDELGMLVDAWTRARGGAGGATMLQGEGGIGKTRLALELLARAESGGAVTAGCAALELGGAAPFGLWAELLGELARALAPARPPATAAWSADVGRLVPALAAESQPPVGSPEFERARLFEAVVELLSWAAGEHPLALLMEDVHLADVASLELAAYVGRRLAELPILLVLTRRDAPRRAETDVLRQALASRGALRVELELPPLEPRALATLVRSVASLSEVEVDRVVAASEGNALLAVEVARAGTVRAPAGVAPPRGLAPIVRAATGRLAPDARAVTELIAVSGRELVRDELLRLPVGQPAAAGAAALESGLLAAREGRIGFRHALLRAAAYDDLAEPRRAELHDQLASALEQAGRAPAAELARHLRLAGRDDAAVVHLERAGIEARRVGALTEAAAFLGEALEIRPHEPELLLELGEVEAWRSRWDEADAAFNEALRRVPAGDIAGLARAHARRGLWFRTGLCAPGRSSAAYREALALLETLPDPSAELLTEVLAGLAWAEGAGGDPDEADALLLRVHQLSGGRLSDEMAATVNSARGMSLCRRGRFAESYGPMLAAADAHVRAGTVEQACVALSNAGCAAAFERDFDRALDYANRALRLGSGAVRLQLHAQAARAYVLSRLGRHEEARAAGEEQCARAERSGSAELLATARHDLGQIALAAGDWAAAAELLGDALDAPARVPRARARLARAEALARLKRADEAETELRAATLEPLRLGDFPATLVPRLTRVQGLVAAVRGDRRLAETRLREAAEAWRRQLAAGERGVYRVDMGRPPVAGLVEPERELAQVERELAALETVPA